RRVRATEGSKVHPGRACRDHPRELVPFVSVDETAIRTALNQSRVVTSGNSARLETRLGGCEKQGELIWCECPMKAFWSFCSSAWWRAGWPEGSCVARGSASSWRFSPA